MTDVLAVMDAASRVLRGSEADPPAVGMVKARNAVAELIADGWNMVASARHTGKDIDPERLAAALVRLQGTRT